jgi:hypothetical protein
MFTERLAGDRQIAARYTRYNRNVKNQMGLPMICFIDQSGANRKEREGAEIAKKRRGKSAALAAFAPSRSSRLSTDQH